MLHTGSVTVRWRHGRDLEGVARFAAVELALGARLPTCPQQSAGVTLCTEGTSLVPLIKAPHAAVKLAAFSVYVTST